MLYIYADCMTNAFERLSSVRHVQKLLQYAEDTTLQRLESPIT